jgi:hypothetical protein
LLILPLFGYDIFGLFQLLQKTGQIERTVDREFADEESKFKAYVFLSIELCGILWYTQIREGMSGTTEG